MPCKRDREGPWESEGARRRDGKREHSRGGGWSDGRMVEAVLSGCRWWLWLAAVVVVRGARHKYVCIIRCDLPHYPTRSDSCFITMSTLPCCSSCSFPPPVPFKWMARNPFDLRRRPEPKVRWRKNHSFDEQSLCGLISVCSV